jgi:hypothetical protein
VLLRAANMMIIQSLCRVGTHHESKTFDENGSAPSCFSDHKTLSNILNPGSSKPSFSALFTDSE